ncbi:MAG: molybdopterin-dependent oxidoreductase [Gemmatimonadaceae bacterium]|nr:molybdopterin-dependent oxidoreductase [Gemmatimonadaceae bacterium]
MQFVSRCILLGAVVVSRMLIPVSDVGAQETARLAVTGDVPTPLTLSPADLAALPRATVSTTNNGMTTTYSGVWVAEVLRKADVALGPGMRGNTLSGYLLAKASDGYQVLFSLGELDPAITDAQVLLADTANDKPLFAENGRFRLVLPNDKRGARSLRMLTTLEVVLLKK